MAQSLRDLRRKMKAIKSTRQVTKAMELVAASKMRKAVSQAVALRQYAGLSWEILERIAGQADQKAFARHPSLQERPVKKVLAVLYTSDRGLCGSLHAQLFRLTNEYLKQLKGISTFESIDFVAVGRKGQQYLARSGQKVVAAFPALSNHPTFRDVLPIKKLVTDRFKEGAYDHVVLIYADFHSALLQEPTIKVLLPFSPSALKDMLASLAETRRTAPEKAMKDASEYKFEPSPAAVLDTIIPQLTEVQVFQAVLEAAASEHSARMVAMRNASDNATDFLGDLTLTYNRSRQEKITAELAELSASAAALS